MRKFWNAFAFVAALLFTIATLGGCATIPEGVQISDQERAACAASGCSVWTEDELQELAKRFLIEGYRRGQAAAKGSI